MVSIAKDMTEGKPFGLLVRFSVPLVLVNVLQMVYTIADGAVVGRILGVEAYASVGATGSIFWMVMGAVFGITQGFGVVLAQRFGAKDLIGLRKSFATSLLLSAVIGVFIAIVGITCSRYVLVELKTPSELLDNSTLFLCILLGGMPITLIFNTLGAMLRALGNSKTPLRSMIISTIVNIVMDIALVIPLGIAGVAIANLLAQVVASVYCALRLHSIQEAHFTQHDFSVAAAKPLLRFGLPLGIRNTIVLASGLAVQRFINDYGTVFVAGVAVAKSMYTLLTIAASAVEAAISTFVGQNFGAKKRERIKQGVRAGLLMMLTSSIMFAIIAILFGHSLMQLLIAGEQTKLDVVLDIGQQQLNMIALGLPALCLLSLYRAALQGMGNMIIPTLSGFLEVVGRFIAVWGLSSLCGIWGAYVADPVGWVPMSTT